MPRLALLSVAAAAIVAANAGAQVPVKESVAAPVTAAARTDEPARLGELFHRLQVLQQEVKELRGTIEEQAFQIQRLTRQQKEQYLDIDQRLVAMRNESPTPGAGTALPRPGWRAPAGSAPPERDAYTSAFELMKESRFEESADAFNRLIADYPNGQYTPNAFYWLGELQPGHGRGGTRRGNPLPRCWPCIRNIARSPMRCTSSAWSTIAWLTSSVRAATWSG